MKNKRNKIIVVSLLSLVAVTSLLPILFYSKDVGKDLPPSIYQTNMIGLVIKGIINGDVFFKVASCVCCFLFYSVLILSMVLIALNKATACKILIPLSAVFCAHIVAVFWNHNEIYFSVSVVAFALAFILVLLFERQEKPPFSIKLKKLRKSLNMSQQELANQTYISRSMIAKFETNAALPSLEDLQALSSFFGVETTRLLDVPKGVEVPYKYFNIFITVHNVFFIISTVLSLAFVFVAVVPVFGGRNLIDGSIANSSVVVQISTVVCSLVLVFGFVWKFYFKSIKSKTIMSIYLDVGFVLNVILITFSLVVGLGGLSM